jgi:flagellar motor protein MotB
MKAFILRHYKNIYFFLLGVSLLVSANDILGPFYEKKVDPIKKSQSLAIFENRLRDLSESFEQKGLKTYIERNPSGLKINVWEDNLFQISDWKPHTKNQDYFSNLAKIIKESNNSIDVEILSHYDSINPFGIGDEKRNKFILTKNRALIVAKILMKNGVNKNRLSVKALGDKSPLVNDRDRHGFFIANKGYLNRRLELNVAFKDKGIL